MTRHTSVTFIIAGQTLTRSTYVNTSAFFPATPSNQSRRLGILAGEDRNYSRKHNFQGILNRCGCHVEPHFEHWTIMKEGESAPTYLPTYQPARRANKINVFLGKRRQRSNGICRVTLPPPPPSSKVGNHPSIYHPPIHPACSDFEAEVFSVQGEA